MTEVQNRIEAMRVPGLGPATYRRLVSAFGSWPAARAASPRDLLAQGVSQAAASALRHPPADAADELRRAQELGVQILTEQDPAYPSGLRDLEDAPLLLYVRGRLSPHDALAVAVVGSRSCSIYGQTQAERLAASLASAGVTIVSGLARGIDAAAHRGALMAKGRTLAVLGCGLASVYPPEHAELAERVCQAGAVLSALPLDATPRPVHFPIRNRLIAALSLGVLVVEAASSSGSLITARLAGEMGKEVFAVPGDITRPQSRGCHALIRDGAKLATCAADVLEELGPLREALPQTVQEEEPTPYLNLNEVERAIYERLSHEPVDIDALCRQTQIAPANAASALLALELRSLIRQLPGKRFVLSARWPAPRR